MNKTFNVIVIDKAGKVGKSTVAKHLIAPMLGADWIQVETFNDSGKGAAAKVAGRKFEYVAEAVVGGTGNGRELTSQPCRSIMAEVVEAQVLNT